MILPFSFSYSIMPSEPGMQQCANWQVATIRQPQHCSYFLTPNIWHQLLEASHGRIKLRLKALLDSVREAIAGGSNAARHQAIASLFQHAAAFASAPDVNRLRSKPFQVQPVLTDQ